MRNANHGRADGGISRGISADPVWQSGFSRGMPRIRGSRKGKRRKRGSVIRNLWSSSRRRLVSLCRQVRPSSLSPNANHPVHESHNSKSPELPAFVKFTRGIRAWLRDKYFTSDAKFTPNVTDIIAKEMKEFRTVVRSSFSLTFFNIIYDVWIIFLEQNSSLI